jgi:hypothetical protein
MAEMVPERWETAVEDLAQLVALGLDRAQDLADAVNDIVRGHPALIKAVGASVAGVLIGGFIADRTRRRPPTLAERSSRAAESARKAAGSAAERAAVQAQAAAEQAAAVAQSAARRVAERLPSREEIQQRIPSRAEIEAQARSRNGHAPRISRSSVRDASQVQYAAQLVPVAITLLRNPLVRDLLVRAAVRAARRQSN